MPVADEPRSMVEAQGHSAAARQAAEKFIASTAA
jgi:hypothetical protein